VSAATPGREADDECAPAASGRFAPARCATRRQRGERDRGEEGLRLAWRSTPPVSVATERTAGRDRPATAVYATPASIDGSSISRYRYSHSAIRRSPMPWSDRSADASSCATCTSFLLSRDAEHGQGGGAARHSRSRSSSKDHRRLEHALGRASPRPHIAGRRSRTAYGHPSSIAARPCSTKCAAACRTSNPRRSHGRGNADRRRLALRRFRHLGRRPPGRALIADRMVRQRGRHADLLPPAARSGDRCRIGRLGRTRWRHLASRAYSAVQQKCAR